MANVLTSLIYYSSALFKAQILEAKSFKEMDTIYGQGGYFGPTFKLLNFIIIFLCITFKL